MANDDNIQDGPLLSNGDNSDDYYQRLVYKCRKELHKQAKVCKSFETRKLIRKRTSKLQLESKKRSEAEKQPQEQQNKLDADAASSITSLAALKDLTLDVVVQEGLRRLGISSSDNEQGVESEQQNQPGTQQQQILVERLLNHKKMRACLEHWSREVATYRDWCRRNKQRDDDDGDKGEAHSKRSKKRKRTTASRDASRMNVVKSQFVQLGSTTNYASDNDDELKGLDGNEDDDIFLANGNSKKRKKQRNRPGQRDRKARAIALEEEGAEGRQRPRVKNSINAKKATRPGSTLSSTSRNMDRPSHSPRPKGTASSAASSASNRNMPASASSAPFSQEAGLHPSWQAHKSKKEGIVAFQGQKIVFG